jgi:phosphoserine phosphatase
VRDILLITVTGPDRPGVTATLTQRLAQADATILDMGQAVIHERLTLGVLVEVAEHAVSVEALEEALKQCGRNLRVKCTPVSPGDYTHWVNQQGKERHIITVLGRKLTAAHIAAVSAVLLSHALNIDVITRLSGRIPLDESLRSPYACIQLSVRGTPLDATAMRGEFLALAQTHGIDIAFQEDDVYRRNRRLVAFDMDSTLIQIEVIDELARAAGVGDEVAAITERAMQGEIDFAESFRQRLALLEGLDEGVLQDIAQTLPLTDGVERLFRMLKHLGFKTAIISGGFTYFGEFLQNRLGADYVYCNQLEIIDGKITGRVYGPIVDGARKAELLRVIADKEKISLKQVIAVGDGANDLPMLSLAGLGIAFRAKPLVKKSARQALSSVGLDGILYLIGVRDRETLEAVQEQVGS